MVFVLVIAEDLLLEELDGNDRAVVLLRRKLRLGPFCFLLRFENEKNSTVLKALSG